MDKTMLDAMKWITLGFLISIIVCDLSRKINAIKLK